MEDARTFPFRLASLLSRERAALGEFLVALASFDEHRLWVDLGYRSLFGRRSGQSSARPHAHAT